MFLDRFNTMSYNAHECDFRHITTPFLQLALPASRYESSFRRSRSHHDVLLPTIHSSHAMAKTPNNMISSFVWFSSLL